MSDEPEPPKYTGHDFADLVTAEVARAEAIALLLRSHGIDARAMETSGWTIAGPSDMATVLVPRPMLEEARTHIKEAVVERGADSDANGHAPIPRCPTCGYSVNGLGNVGTCPECGAWFMLPAEEPGVSANLRAKREKARPIAFGLAILILAAVLLLRVRSFW